MQLFNPKSSDLLIFFESTRKDAEVAYAKNPIDAENLSQWGKALLELSQFQNPSDAVQFVEDATSKLEEALQIAPRKHDTLWCLGNAHTSRALLLTDIDSAKIYFEKATQCFKQALEEDPGNMEYKRSIEFSFQARELHAEIQRQIQPDAVGRSLTSNIKAPELHAEIQRQIQSDAVGRSLTSNTKRMTSRDRRDENPMKDKGGGKALEPSASLPGPAKRVVTDADQKLRADRVRLWVPRKKKKNDLKYDILGWVILAVGIVTWVGMAKHHMPTAPSPPR